MTIVPRVRVFLAHLSGSTAVALCSLIVVFQIWYPSPLQSAVGVTSIYLILLAVDVTLGPLLTLIVYKPGKRLLWLDLLVIVVLQVAAFGYGIASLASGRPVWLVYNAGRFDLIQSFNVDERKLSEASPDYRHQSWLGPRWVSLRAPSDNAEHDRLLFDAVVGGVDLPQRPELYQPLERAAEQIRRQAQPLSRLTQFNAAKEVSDTLRSWPAANAYLPMMAKSRHVTVLVQRESGKVVAVVDLRPW